MLSNMGSSSQRRSVDSSRCCALGEEVEWDSEDERRQGGSGKGKGKAPMRDTSGRVVPPAERAPTH